jgi:hypothetical protein
VSLNVHRVKIKIFTMKNLLKIGKELTKAQQKEVVGGEITRITNPTETTPGFDNHYPNCPNPWIPCDSDGRDCRFPFHVNQFGRCTLN